MWRVVAVAAALVLAGCGSARAVEAVEWRAEEVLAEPIPDTLQVTLQLEAGRAFGRGGCNRFTGGVDLAPADATRGSLRFGAIAGTRMACPPPQMALEQKVFAAFEATTAYQVDATGRLRLLDAAGATLMVLVR